MVKSNNNATLLAVTWWNQLQRGCSTKSLPVQLTATTAHIANMKTPTCLWTFLKFEKVQRKHFSKSATFTLKANLLHFHFSLHFSPSLLWEWLPSACRHVGVFHANYWQLWQCAIDQSRRFLVKHQIHPPTTCQSCRKHTFPSWPFVVTRGPLSDL